MEEIEKGIFDIKGFPVFYIFLFPLIASSMFKGFFWTSVIATSIFIAIILWIDRENKQISTPESFQKERFIFLDAENRYYEGEGMSVMELKSWKCEKCDEHVDVKEHGNTCPCGHSVKENEKVNYKE